MKVITYRIRLLEPVLVTSLDGDPNSATAFDYVPGSVLRGAVIGKFLQARNLTAAQFNSADGEAQRLFFNGTTRYLNGYPMENGLRALPVPQSWRHEKGKEGKFFDFGVEPREDEEDQNGNSIQWQGVGTPFCLLIYRDGEAEARLIQPDRVISVHTARDRKYGRAMPGSGAVYRYEALQGGQTFETAVLCDHDTDTAMILPLLDGEATLGGSRSGGYGRVRFGQARESPAWREVAGTLQPIANGRLTITLLSDAIVRDLNGQCVVDSRTVAAVLSSSLGNLPLKPDKTRTFLRGTTIGGFNRKWGLPLQQSLAVKMGSVFVYDAPPRAANALSTAVDGLEKRGIGERRAEGFGRVAVNWQAEESLIKNETKAGLPPPKVISDSASLAIAQGMVKRMLRQLLDAALAQRANSLGKGISGPKNSQLSRLRLIIHDALRQGPAAGRPRLNQYLDGLYERQTTRGQFTRGDRVAGKTLLDWLRDRVADDSDEDSDIWTEIGVDRHKLPTVGANVTATALLTADMAYEYNLRLIDGVLARAAKTRKGER